MTLTAIPTFFDGVLFRSRLEARVAAVFNRLDITWVYENEAYYLPSGEGYSPDFYLPECRVFVEVKPREDTPSVRKAEAFAAMIEADGGVIYLMFPSHSVRTGRRGGRTNLLAATRLRDIGTSVDATFVRCPACGTIQPEVILSGVPLRCCGDTMDDAQWHRPAMHVHTVELPQYQNGVMIFPFEEHGIDLLTSDIGMPMEDLDVIDVWDADEWGWLQDWVQEREWEAILAR